MELSLRKIILKMVFPLVSRLMLSIFPMNRHLIYSIVVGLIQRNRN